MLRRGVGTTVRGPRICGAALVGLGVFVGVGWISGSTVMAGVVGGGAPTKPISAACMIAFGAALVAAPRRRAVSTVLCGLVGAVGLLTVVEHMVNQDLWIDRWLRPAAVDRIDAGGPHPQRMALMIAVCFVVLAAALLGSRLWPSWACAGAALVLATGYVSVLGYLYGAGGRNGVEDFTGVPLYSAVGLMIGAAGALFVAPPRQAVGMIRGNLAVRALCLRLVPVAVLAPPVLGSVRLYLQQIGVVDQPLGLGVMTLGWTASMLLVGWRAAVVIERIAQVADHDPLTGLLNRRGFARRLEEHERLVERYGPTGALLVIDLDHLKVVNDEY
jgi:hypothetical protein